MYQTKRNGSLYNMHRITVAKSMKLECMGDNVVKKIENQEWNKVHTCNCNFAYSSLLDGLM